jgi:hypothetical protein
LDAPVTQADRLEIYSSIWHVTASSAEYFIDTGDMTPNHGRENYHQLLDMVADYLRGNEDADSRMIYEWFLAQVALRSPKADQQSGRDEHDCICARPSVV